MNFLNDADAAVLATRWVLKITMLVLVAWDLFVIWRFGHRPSISVVLRTWGKEEMAIVLILGIIIGHIFWVDSPVFRR